MHGLHRTLYGYLMNCFAYLDLLSFYRSRTHNSGGDQTERMVRFMEVEMRYEPLPSQVAVLIWRHKLMHTAKPRALEGRNTGESYKWLLHWGSEHLPREYHMQLQQPKDARTLNIGLGFLVDDLVRGAESYFAKVDGSPEAEARLAAAYQEVLRPRLFDD